ncbi:Uncharacterised protein [Sphingobacterium daejeonense]|nr:Uncharacterised protein [Sphingobacterium daejeonense]
MQSFRTELENPVVEQEIIELEKKIRAFQQGELPEEKIQILAFSERSLWSETSWCTNGEN